MGIDLTEHGSLENRVLPRNGDGKLMRKWALILGHPIFRPKRRSIPHSTCSQITTVIMQISQLNLNILQHPCQVIP
jgi:hypothetical protein